MTLMSFRMCVGVLVAVGLSVAGCSDDGGDSAASTSTTTSTTEATTTTTIDTSVVPDEITIEYVQAVIDELYAIEAEAIDIWWNTEGRLVEEPVVDRLVAVFGTEHGADRVNELADAAQSGELDRYADPPGPLIHDVQRIEGAHDECIAAIVNSDFGERIVGGEMLPSTFVLRRNEPGPVNETAWIVEGLRVTPEGDAIEEDLCVE